MLDPRLLRAFVAIADAGSFTAAADRLHMTSRTLRRKLLAEGTCYAKLPASVRKELAIRYLRTTRMKTEAIAQSLGFSDVANFRQAFRKWTNKNPSEFRCRGNIADGGEGRIVVTSGLN